MAAAESIVCRDSHGRFKRKPIDSSSFTSEHGNFQHIEIEHNYLGGHFCNSKNGCGVCCPGIEKLQASSRINTSVLEGSEWYSGRRLVEWQVLFDNLSCCISCNFGPLYLSRQTVKGEMKCGLGGYLYVMCTSCSYINRIAYGSTHRLEKTKGMPSFCVNTKLGAAMIDALGGPQRVNNVLTTLNLPPISHKNLKKMERRAGEMIEEYAHWSMEQRSKEAYEAELRDTENKNQARSLNSESDHDKEQNCQEDISVLETAAAAATVEENVDRSKPKNKEHNIFGMTVCADHGWQKRGFDSLTGHTFLLSKRKYGNKVLKTIVKHRTCATCKWWRRNRPGIKPRHHRCVWNHHGSSRMMESQAGKEAIKDLIEQGTPVKVIEGDGDNTLIARLQSEMGVHVIKKLDKNHCIKNIVKGFYDLRNSKEVKISNQVILHLTKSIKYVFSKNQGNEVQMRENLQALIPHQFGDHTLCLARFCGYKRRPDTTYLHRSLPYKAPLSDPVLKEKLMQIFEPIVAKAALYSDLGCSQACEHANRATSLRAPKHLHYGESESLHYRVKATAACINEGRNYLSETFRKNFLSPGSFTKPYNLKKDSEREIKRSKANLPETKMRRMALKEERAKQKGAHEASEGAKYDSEISLDTSRIDLQQIPDAIPKPSFCSLPTIKDVTPLMIFMDLETTDLIRRSTIPHITQIAALEKESRKVFSTYVLPTLPVSPNAEKITGIVYDGKQLFVKSQPVCAVKISKALENFILWLQQFGTTIMCAHNGRKFDFRVLSTALEKCNLLKTFTECCLGFTDTLPVIKSKVPNVASYTQSELSHHFDLGSYNAHNAHNAVDDVKMLSCILHEARISDKCIIQNAYSSQSHSHQEHFIEAKMKNLPSLHQLFGSGVMKMTTAEKIAGSGLNFNHLYLIWQRKGEDGLADDFTSKNMCGKARVLSLQFCRNYASTLQKAIDENL